MHNLSAEFYDDDDDDDASSSLSAWLCGSPSSCLREWSPESSETGKTSKYRLNPSPLSLSLSLCFSLSLSLSLSGQRSRSQPTVPVMISRLSSRPRSPLWGVYSPLCAKRRRRSSSSLCFIFVETGCVWMTHVVNISLVFRACCVQKAKLIIILIIPECTRAPLVGGNVSFRYLFV